MSRDITAGMLTAISQQVIRSCLFVKLEFIGTTLYLSSLTTNINWDSQTWLGNGLLMGVDGIEEVLDLKAVGWTVRLEGSNATLVSLALGSTNQSKKGYFYFGILDSTETLVLDPELLQVGNFDTAVIEDSGDRSSIVLHYESELIQRSRSKELRYTDFSQQAIFPGDRGFQYAPQAEDWSGFWGKAARPRHRRKRKVGRN